jgi:hypothetical protein
MLRILRHSLEFAKEGTHAAQVIGKFTNKAPKGYKNVQYSDKDRRIIPD